MLIKVSGGPGGNYWPSYRPLLRAERTKMIRLRKRSTGVLSICIPGRYFEIFLKILKKIDKYY